MGSRESILSDSFFSSEHPKWMAILRERNSLNVIGLKMIRML